LNSVAFSSGLSFIYRVVNIFIVFINFFVALLIMWVMGHGSVFVWVSGSWVTVFDPLFTPYRTAAV